MSAEFIRRPFLCSRRGDGKRHRLSTLNRVWRDLLRRRGRRSADPAPIEATRIEQTVFDFAKKKDGF